MSKYSKYSLAMAGFIAQDSISHSVYDSMAHQATFVCLLDADVSTCGGYALIFVHF